MVPVHPTEVLCPDDVAHFQLGAAVFTEDQGIEDAIGVVCFGEVGHLDVGRVLARRVEVPGRDVEQRLGLVDADGLLDSARQGGTLRILHRNELEGAALVLRGVPDHLVKIGAGDDLIGDDGVAAQQAHRAGGSLAILALDGRNAHEGRSRLFAGSAEDIGPQSLVLAVCVRNRRVFAVGGKRFGLRHRVAITFRRL